MPKKKREFISLEKKLEKINGEIGENVPKYNSTINHPWIPSTIIDNSK